MDIATEITALDAKIAEAKTYLKKLRQYKRTLTTIQATEAEITALEAEPATIKKSLIVQPAPPEAPKSPETAPTIQTPIAAPEPTENRQETAAILPFPANDLSNLSIRQLKALAKSHKLPRYGSLTKAELITALSGFPAAA